ncbi:Peptidase S8, subtilisin-related protein [Corchorus olitorius]|uniref:Peptidase S8, subtilisin-related protein n=1 Tax=Corchorus olitorius TaxID=93759 RepID=A0A1R3J8I6_9ROSI|nr:Peptidase S8, subtilisin-related protein [Corchorus olitorius]
MDKSRNIRGELSYGSGHVDPLKAIDPGLVYEAFKEDYIKLMCSMGYPTNLIKGVTAENTSCPKTSENVPPRDLNYPSLTALVASNKSFTVTFHRTVKNVGHANSTYKAQVSRNPKLKVEVLPAVLSFKALEEKKSFNVTVRGGALQNRTMLSTTLIWSDGTHFVRSPILVHTYPSVDQFRD